MQKVALTEEVRAILLEKILVDPDQPRRGFPPEKLQSLVNSIRTLGIQVPLVVRPTAATAKPPGVGECYTLVAGERRLRAAKVAGLQSVPAVIRELSDADARTLQMVENLEREDLTALEEAQGYRSLLELGLSQKDVGERVGRTQAHISNLVRLLELPAEVLEALHAGKLTARHARAFLPLAAHPHLVQATVKSLLGQRWEEIPPAEDLEAQLPHEVRHAAEKQVRPLTREAYWGPENPLGGKGALFRPGDAIPVKKLTPGLQKQATEAGTFYHPGPCTTCPHGFRAKSHDGLCLEPTGACYGIRQEFAASGPLKGKAGREAAERAKLQTAGKAQRKKERAREAREHGRWAKAVAKAQAVFRRRPARPRELYLRAVCEKFDDWQMKPQRVAVILGADLERLAKGKAAAVKANPLPVLGRLSERRLQEVLRTIYAVEDAGRRTWRKSWPFKPPVKGLAGWGG